MVNNSLIKPRTISVHGASNNLAKPGGQLIKNLKQSFGGNIYPVNPHEEEIQGLKNYTKISDLPHIDLAILALPAKICVDVVNEMSKTKHTKAFIIISAGFSETDAFGKALEDELAQLASTYKLSIVGPNCIGVLNINYKGLFVAPPILQDKNGVDFVSASGALAVFMFEQAALQGLHFHSVFTVGNSMQIGVEELLEYWDQNNYNEAPKIKMLYIEQIKNAQKFYKHATSLRQKGCVLIVMKPGDSEAGTRAKLSHTGALAGDNTGENLLLEKCGAIRCYSRTSFLNTALVFSNSLTLGQNVAIITHAGGPAVLLSDQLQKEGYNIPELPQSTKLKIQKILNPGASAINPIDVLATGTKEQLVKTLLLLDNEPAIECIIVIYGNNGMDNLFEVYPTLRSTVTKLSKPVFIVMPSVHTADKAMLEYVKSGGICFFDEVELALALGKIKVREFTPAKVLLSPKFTDTETPKALAEKECILYLQKFNIPYISHTYLHNVNEPNSINSLQFPIVAKALGILHKTEYKAVITHIRDKKELQTAIQKLSLIPDNKGMLLQEMTQGIELYIGVLAHDEIGYSIHFGLGGTHLEILKDITSSLLPVNPKEALQMVNGIKAVKLLEGYRGKAPIDKQALVEILLNVGNLIEANPHIRELDINPLIANAHSLNVVDVRIII